jgi:hypothetical protein
MSTAVYSRIESMLDQLDREEQLLLIDELATRFRGSVLDYRVHSESLHGAWKGLLPADLDLDAELKEIRSEWTKEWDEAGEWTDT